MSKSENSNTKRISIDLPEELISRFDHLHGFSIYGLGFAGYVVITEKSDISYLKKFGPEKLLENFV